MTSTLCQSIALDRLIALWAAQIAGFLIAIVETILTIARISVPPCKSPALRLAPSDGEDRDHGPHAQAAVPRVPTLVHAHCQPGVCSLPISWAASVRLAGKRSLEEPGACDRKRPAEGVPT